MSFKEQHIIPSSASIYDALTIIDKHGLYANVLFVIDEDGHLLGSLSDGDIRRGLLKGYTLQDSVNEIKQTQFKYLREGDISTDKVEELKQRKIFFVPILSEENHLVDIIDLNNFRPVLPIHSVIMAGGKGQRLLPLTKDTPKPLLMVGSKPIIEHNIDRLNQSGIKDISISVNYLGNQLVSYFGDGQKKGIQIDYVHETEFLGTIASAKMVKEYKHDTILLMNSDLLTNIDFVDFYSYFKKTDADMAIASTSYHVDIPYAVMEVDANERVHSLREKPRYSYYSNAGIYLIKRELLNMIPDNTFYNVTDLIERLLVLNRKVLSYPILGYWLDIGKHEDYKKAQEDIKYLNL